MIFRIDNSKLYMVDLDFENEELEKAFVDTQNANGVFQYMFVTDDQLPYNPYPTTPFYMVDSNSAIVLDTDRMLDNYKQETIDTINRMRDSMIEEGYTWTDPLDSTKQYVFGLEESDKISMIALATAVNLGQTENLFFITKDNITLPLTVDQAKDLALKSFSYVSYIYYTARTYKDRILRATTFEDIATILSELDSQINS